MPRRRHTWARRRPIGTRARINARLAHLGHLRAWVGPAQLVVGAFALLILLGTLSLALPAASATGTSHGLVTALFTATSAVCVTGLVIVDTGGDWSLMGQLIILALIQIGGLGIMTLATMLTLLVTRRIRLRMQLTAEVETKSLSLEEARQLTTGVILLSLSFELATTLALTARLALSYDYSPLRAIYFGLFHAVSAFNNAGFALYSDSLMRYATDPWVILPIALAVICGGLGFPVWLELWRHSRRRARAPRRWSLHARLTLWMTGVLLMLGMSVITALEWNNPHTLGPLSPAQKLLTGFFHSVMPRTAGFNSMEVGDFQTQSLFFTNLLMFIGGGSAGTAGGIKVTTFVLLACVIYATARAEPSVRVGDRRLGTAVQHQAVTVALLSVGAVFASTWIMMMITPFTLDRILFEVISAFATVGLSTGITADLPPGGHLLLVVLMFFGRLGPITLATALALRPRTRRFDLPEERPIVG